MRLKEKVKEKFVLRCGKCGYASGQSITSSFTGWLFHQQLCACDETLSGEPLSIETSENAAEAITKLKIDLGERFEVVEVLGKGGMGVVYKANDKTDGTTVAIKVLSEDLGTNENIFKRFEQEALAVSRLNHTKLIAVKTTGQSLSGMPFIVMEYFEGQSLAELIKGRGHLSVPETFQISMQICEALEHAHAFGVIHRDIKPSNILLAKEGDHYFVKVVDFGIAKADSDQKTETPQLTQAGEIFGSPAYMSPEQCLGDETDERSDIYSLGCVMYEMLTGKSPFASENPIQSVLKHVNEEPDRFEIEFDKLRIPSQFENIIFKCLQKSPAKRYPTIFALEIDLKRLGGHPAALYQRFHAAVVDVGICFLAIELITSFDQFLRPWQQHLAMNICWYGALPFYVFLESFGQLKTPGKHLWNLSVTDCSGLPVNWLKSNLRMLTLLGILSVPICLYLPTHILMLLLGLTHSHPVGSTDVIKFVLLSAVLIYFCLIGFSKNKLSPLDRLFDRVVATRNFLPKHDGKSSPPSKLQWGIGLASLASILASVYLSPRIVDHLQAVALARNVFPCRNVVYVVKKISAENPVSEDSVDVRRVPDYEVQTGALSSKLSLPGRFADIDLEVGDIVTDTNAEARTPVVYASKNLEKGKPITKESLEIRKVREVQVLPSSFSSITDALGRVPAYDIKAGIELTSFLLNDNSPSSKL